LKSPKEILQLASKTIEIEAKAVARLSTFLNDDFVAIITHIYNSKGRVVVTGIGKSAIVANKIVATLNSTGTPAIFMHAADAIHGDIGIITKSDIVICISKSGNTPEIKVLVPLIKSLGNRLIALVGNTNSYLALQADHILNATVEQEACPNNLAPTTSTTAQMVMGDTLAVCLLVCRDFTSSDFARYHPGGTLGKQLYLKVNDVFVHNMVPKVNSGDSLKTVIMEISAKRLGATAVFDGTTLAGLITDGDLRRMMERHDSIENVTASDIMNPKPKTIAAGAMAVEALQVMKSFNISQLVVLNEHQAYAGIIHLHDLIKEGII
jgi:arabinose-5-phosphate isomerase